MPSKHTIEVTVPIPPEVAPGDVVATLQTFEPLLDNHGYVVNYWPKSGPISNKDLAIIKGDPFFEDERHDLPSQDIPLDPEATDSRWWLCDVWEDVYYVPFIVPYFSRLKRYLAIGCRTEGGIRFRQRVSGGVVTRGTFTIISRETGRPYVPRTREDVWDGETENGSIASNDEDTGEGADEGGDEERVAGNRKSGRNWDAQDETDTETEPSWDIVCACEIEMPLILVMSQILKRDENRALCEHLCKAIITATRIAFR
ncbi:hypothetical protein F5B22DRAFT_633873 [Xylaria bambusicola]|uniref:uncharacterized protein n=1 Tax=Xylaria bambusicola TaxID=326684 RepID=UPI002007BC3D|nr:uncharacterized protein F5B22DRAFT_633873 [Xylaria bambusicola]KAI0523763.1 hypothetical protein F5B22DRAFT_633873 [Xylaria bambusicola]